MHKLLEEAVRKKKRNTARSPATIRNRIPKQRGVKRGTNTVAGHASGTAEGGSADRCAVACLLPHCESKVIGRDTQAQYQEDIVRVTWCGDLTWRWGCVPAVDAGCKEGIRCRPPMPCT